MGLLLWLRAIEYQTKALEAKEYEKQCGGEARQRLGWDERKQTYHEELARKP